jgi:hypothetical protein
MNDGLTSDQKYYRKNKDKVLASNKRYHQSHIAQIREKKRLWQRENRKRHPHCKNPISIYHSIKASAKERNYPILITSKQFAQWWTNQEHKCYYCKRTQGEVEKDTRRIHRRRLTVDRKDNSLGYTLENIVLACYLCNETKSDFFSEEDMLVIGEIVRKKCLEEPHVHEYDEKGGDKN